MCVLILLHRVHPKYPVLVAANRDERRNRLGDPPRVESAPRPPGPTAEQNQIQTREDAFHPYLSPGDPEAGGTWLGASLPPRHFFAGLTNRRDEVPGPPGRSRGLLVRDVLGSGSVAAGRERLEREIATRTYAPFNLMMADRDRAVVAHFDGGLRWEALSPGVHLLINDYDVDPETARGLEEGLLPPIDFSSIPLEEVFAALENLLRDETPRLPESQAICKTGGDRGTTSSSVIALHRDDPAQHRFLFADGPPSHAPYREFGLT